MTLNPTIKVSVLIPVYNVENSIARCAHSLFNQTLKEDIEYIFVNDATPDNSINILYEIIKQYPFREKQIKIINHDRNQGIAETRYTALINAKGEYVIYCDSDDWVEPNMYELLYKEAKKKNSIITSCDAWVEKDGVKQIMKQRLDLPHQSILVELLKSGGKVNGCLWNRLIKRDFFISGKFRAQKGTTMLDDLAITFPMHLKSPSLAYIPVPLYHYIKNNNSITSTYNSEALKSSINVYESLLTLPVEDKLKNLLLKKIILTITYFIRDFRNFKPDIFRNELSPFLKNYQKNISLNLKLRILLIHNKWDKLAFYHLLISNLLTFSKYWYRIKNINFNSK